MSDSDLADEILEMQKDGLTNEEIGEHLGISREQVRRIAARLECRLAPPELVDAVVKAHVAGEMLVVTAKRLGLPTWRIYQARTQARRDGHSLPGIMAAAQKVRYATQRLTGHESPKWAALFKDVRQCPRCSLRIFSGEEHVCPGGMVEVATRGIGSWGWV